MPEYCLMTILELLKASTEHLRSKGFSNPKTSCEILLAHALGMKRLDLYLNFDRKVSQTDRDRFKELYKRRLEHEPLQYITGETEFMSLPFRVDRNVLIPRPETEFVVEQTMRIARTKWGGEPVSVLDIGAGCGNIAISLAHYLPNARIIAYDISSEAVEVARANAVLNNLADRIEFNVRDIFDCKPEEHQELNIVISNPPYVAENDRSILEKEVIDHEPHIALFAGEDGMKFFSHISGLARSWLVPDGMIVFETGYNIGAQVVEAVTSAGYVNIQLQKDYARNDRLLTADQPGP
ncbi:peptide chain release factor N(5)-glutamine methyltransferase [candidate division KSB1 bacterium]